MAAPGKHVLTYWPIRGLGAPCRIAFTLAGLPFDDAHPDRAVFFGPNPMREANPMLNLPCVTLPNGRIIVQSGAIFRYIARLGNLYGASDEDRCRVDEVLEHLVDLNREKSVMTYDKENHASHKADFLTKSIPYYFGTLEGFIAKNGTSFAAANELTIADVVLYEHSSAVLALFGEDALAAYPLVMRTVLAVKNHPKLAAYHTQAAATPFNGFAGAWGAMKI